MPADTRAWISAPLARQGFKDARALLDLPGEIVGGHPDRHVVRVVLDTGRGRLVGYLKREHRVSLRDRVANACAGFGFVSKSLREAQTLGQLRAAGVPVPRVLAYGECGGRAFLLVQALPGYRDLREILRTGWCTSWQRRLLARRLGRMLARVHAAGFDMPDLLCKHVLIDRRTLRPALIDCARTRRCRQIPAETRIHDLALLHASLPNELATLRERLACLRAYRGTAPVRAWADIIRHVASVLPRRRVVRESCQPSGGNKRQRVRWVAGDESLCVTSEFWQRGRGQIPDWLRSAAEGSDPPRTVVRRWLGDTVILRNTPPVAAWRRLLAKVCGRRVTSPTVREAGLIFRLQRFGVAAPRLLAFGGRGNGGGFLLTRPISDTLPLKTWLTSPHERRPRLLRRLGRLLRRLHGAGCCLDVGTDVLHVRGDGRGAAIADVRGVRIQTLRTDTARRGELRRLLRDLGIKSNSADAHHAVRGYYGTHANAGRLVRTDWL
jgi:tRNA A-37 threonylcarbamoyl transferase component Bud32